MEWVVLINGFKVNTIKALTHTKASVIAKYLYGKTVEVKLKG